MNSNTSGRENEDREIVIPLGIPPAQVQCTIAQWNEEKEEWEEGEQGEADEEDEEEEQRKKKGKKQIKKEDKAKQ